MWPAAGLAAQPWPRSHMGTRIFAAKEQRAGEDGRTPRPLLKPQAESALRHSLAFYLLHGTELYSSLLDAISLHSACKFNMAASPSNTVLNGFAQLTCMLYFCLQISTL